MKQNLEWIKEKLKLNKWEEEKELDKLKEKIKDEINKVFYSDNYNPTSASEQYIKGILDKIENIFLNILGEIKKAREHSYRGNWEESIKEKIWRKQRTIFNLVSHEIISRKWIGEINEKIINVEKRTEKINFFTEEKNEISLHKRSSSLPLPLKIDLSKISPINIFNEQEEEDYSDEEEIDDLKEQIQSFMPFSSNILLENKFINKREKSNIQKETDISEKKKNEINEKEIECYLCRKKSLELLEIKEENEILKEKIKKLEQEKEELKNEKNSNLASEVLII